jgi:hypothetical protein
MVTIGDESAPASCFSTHFARSENWAKMLIQPMKFRGFVKVENGASEGIRTLDTHVGNVMLYQAELRSLPIRPGEVSGTGLLCKF